MIDTLWTPHVTVATIVAREGRFLCVEEDVDGRIVLNQPAGHLDPGESLAEAAVRETLEETACEVRVTALLAVSRWLANPTADTILRFTFAGELLRRHPDRPLDAGIRRALWLTRAELEARRAAHRSPLVLASVAAFEAGRRYPLDLLSDIAPELAA